MQTILGSGGAIGIELAKALTKYTKEIRLVSRSPKKVNAGDELFAVDLLIPEMVDKAVEGSKIAYVTLGFKYDINVWRTNWPIFIENVINACIKHNCKLVFFDNIYMYDPVFLNRMDEETPHNPVSKKGKVRAEIVNMIMDKIARGELNALIARAADFYGPGIKNVSMLTETVFNPLHNNKKANWMCSLKYKHSFTYVPDAGVATAMLGNTEDAYKQTWHLPTAKDPFTGKEWIDTIAKKMGKIPKIQLVSPFQAGIIGIFSPIMKELKEMMYQYDCDYVFDSSKFEKRFGFTPTPYSDGIDSIIRADYS
jgi:nucleoside-diphosphate-sugar epimerase